MNYTGANVAITGWSGFLGGALAARLSDDYEANVECLEGDVRDPFTFAGITHETKYLFHFGAPSSQVLFERNPAHCIDVTMKGFANALEACKRTGTRLVFPSTGILSSGRFNMYAKCKSLCEDMARGTDAIALRIFATYGIGEKHKRDFASVPYLFARSASRGQHLTVFGDGSQTRDFIYVDDTVNTILRAAEEWDGGPLDVGSGTSVSFNEIIEHVSDHFPNVRTSYVHAPKGYVKETTATTASHGLWEPQVSLEEGIARVAEWLAGDI